MLAAQNLRTGWILETLMQLPEFRHLQDPEYFSLDFSGVHSPLLLPDMELAVLFLKEAMEKKQTILIVGDRDVDGVSSTALIGMFLRHHFQIFSVENINIDGRAIFSGSLEMVRLFFFY